MKFQPVMSGFRTGLKMGGLWLLLLAAILTLLPTVASAQSVDAAQTRTDIPCINSPFGQVLSVGQSQFVGG